MPRKIPKNAVTNESPEKLYRKQCAFKEFVAGELSIAGIAKIFGVTSRTVYRLIDAELWTKHKKIWLENPGKEMPYPWEVERAAEDKLAGISVGVTDPNNLSKDLRQKCIAAFGMYCTGQTSPFICEQLDIEPKVLNLWVITQRWGKCRQRLMDGESPAPWDDEDVPMTMADITMGLESMHTAIKFSTATALKKASEYASDMDEAEAFEKIRNIKQLAEAMAVTFIDPKAAGNISINIGSKLESIKVPDPQTFEAELIVNE